MVSMLASRKKGKVTSVAQPTLASVLQSIEVDGSIPAKRRADICSGVRSLCRAVGLQLENTPAEPRFLADRLADVTPAAARMSKRRFENCRSLLEAALAHADVLAQRRRNRGSIAPDYQALLSGVPNGWKRKKLSRFCRFASAAGVAPEDVNDDMFDTFREALQDSTVENFRVVDRETRKIWNEMVNTVPDWPGQMVSVPYYVDHYTLPPEVFPDNLWRELDAYLDSRRHKGSSDLDELLTDAELLGHTDSAEHQRIRESTAKLIRYRVRQFASALVIEKVMRADQITGLEVLVRPKTVSDGLMFFIRRADGERRNSQIHGIASDLLMIAKLWVRSPESDIKKLNKICGKVRRRPDGLPESARRSLAPFADPGNVRAFLRLPERIVADVERRKKLGRSDANRVAAALWIKIAQRAPLRIANLLETDLDTNILRSHKGKDATVSLYYPPDQVKNNKALEVPLSKSTAKLLDLYLTKYRKLLFDAPSPWLFPSADGGPKRTSIMAQLIQNLMNEYVGFAINPHSFRHVAAKLYLSAYPGRYVDVQLLLGHSKLDTTIKYYCQLEAEEVFKHFDTVLLKLEQGAA